MPFTISSTDEEAEDVGPLLEKINDKFGRTEDYNILRKGHDGGRAYLQAWDDPTLHQHNEIPLGGQLIDYAEALPEDKLVALGEACKKGDSAAVKRLLGIRRLSGVQKYVGVDLGFKCQGPLAISTFMQALTAELECLDVNLQGNQLMMPGIKAVAEGLPKQLLQLRIDLSHNRIQASGLEIFMKAIPRTVTSLTIGCGGMKMGLPGIKAIADHLPPNLKEFTVDLHDGLMGDDGCIYLSSKFPKTMEKLSIHMQGDQGHLTNRGYWIFDRLIGDSENPHGLPKLTRECFLCLREDTRNIVQQYEITEQSREIVQRWRPHENVC